MTRTRLKPEERRAAILAAAIACAKRDGYTNATKEAVAKEADISASLVNRYFSTMKQLRQAVMRAAVAQPVVEVVAQGLIANDRLALAASPDVKRKAVEYLSNR